MCVFTVLTCKSLKHKAFWHFWRISTSKSGPTLVVFDTFDVQTVKYEMFWHFLTTHLATWLRTCRFSEPTFPPPGATKHRKKTQRFATFLPVHPRLSSFFSDSLSLFWSSFFLLSLSLLLFSLLTLSLSLFSLSLSSDWLHWPTFIVQQVGGLTPKLPSVHHALIQQKWLDHPDQAAVYSYHQFAIDIHCSTKDQLTEGQIATKHGKQ